jgi:hypothetical protein
MSLNAAALCRSAANRHAGHCDLRRWHFADEGLGHTRAVGGRLPHGISLDAFVAEMRTNASGDIRNPWRAEHDSYNDALDRMDSPPRCASASDA